MTGLTIGSMCSGAGGLELGIEAATGVHTIWQAEPDPHASTVLAARFPGTPNHGDIRTVDWATVPTPDVLCAGFPCQPVSQAGRRAGTTDERWLWNDITTALSRMDPPPRLLLFENVAGLLTANSGDAMADVVQGLAEMRYVGRYGLLRSSDIGAPHRRERVFIAATHTERCPGNEPDGHDALGRWPGEPEQARLGSSATPDAAHDGQHRSRPARHRRTGPQNSHPPTPDPAGSGDPHQPGGSPSPRLPGGPDLGGTAGLVETWGPYAAAVRHWELIHGPAPAPRDNQGRLNPALPEWMMGLPPGWVTDLDIPRGAQLRLVGNAVQPQVAELAARLLLAPMLTQPEKAPA